MKICKNLVCGLMLVGLMFFCQKTVCAEEFIVENGKANAEIILPKIPNKVQLLAVKELKGYIFKINPAEVKVSAQNGSKSSQYLCYSQIEIDQLFLINNINT